MDLYDKDGNFVGQFIEKEKEKIEEVFDYGLWPLAIIMLFIAPFWTILAIILWLIFKGALCLIKLILKLIWWVIRLPFYIIFVGACPNFNQKDK